MRDYRLYELSSGQYEELIILICREILGMGTIGFSQGPDGGRDGRFEGTANRFPSEQKPWSGKFVIQAKHTTNPTASCSDRDFSINQSGVIAKEKVKMKGLFERGEIGNYLLFTNRKLSGETESKIRQELETDTGISNVAVIGLETQQSYLKAYPVVVKLAELERQKEPLRFDSSDIKDVILAFREYVGRGEPSFSDSDFEDDPISLVSKNKLNQLSERYFKLICNRYQPYFGQIQQFLGDPINEELADMYYNIADELNAKITARREDFGKFEEIFTHLYDQVLEMEPGLKSRRLVNLFLHFMYWKCDLGET